MKHYSIRALIPDSVAARLYGDRRRFGRTILPDDPNWIEWEALSKMFYFSTQKKSIGGLVNKAGYTVMKKIDLSNKRVLEIGPGDLSHVEHWTGLPEHYVIADVKEDLLQLAVKQLELRGINFSSVLLPRDYTRDFPFDQDQFDTIVTFYSLEHLYPLEEYLDCYLTALKSGGVLIGAIPAEGGLSWGMGRYFYSKRWVERQSAIDFNKIICWEHPNYADTVMEKLDTSMKQVYINYWPLAVPVIDMNLIIKLIYEK